MLVARESHVTGTDTDTGTDMVGGERPTEYAYVSVMHNMAHTEPLIVVHTVGPFARLVARHMAPYMGYMARADRFDPYKESNGNPFVTDYVRSAGVRTSYMRPATAADYACAFSVFNYETGQFERCTPFAKGEGA